MGALCFLEKPLQREAARSALARCRYLSLADARRLLVVGDDIPQRTAVVELLCSSVQEVTTASVSGAPAALRAGGFQCVVLTAGTSEFRPLEILEALVAGPAPPPPVMIFTSRELSLEAATELSRFAELLIAEEIHSMERLLYKVSLYLHTPCARLEDAQASTLERAMQTASRLEGVTILVLDDDVRNIFAMTSVLEHHGARVVFAESGEGALAILDSMPDIDAVLLDIMMPDMDGFAVLRRIRSQPRYWSLPVFAVTAKAMPADRAKCMQAGATGYVSKPVDVQHLLSLLRVWVVR
jgi:CheY-like chemotaxis protein